MTESFREYRRECFIAIRNLLVHKPMVAEMYHTMAKDTKSENELSRLMADVRLKYKGEY